MSQALLEFKYKINLSKSGDVFSHRLPNISMSKTTLTQDHVASGLSYTQSLGRSPFFNSSPVFSPISFFNITPVLL